MSNPSPGPLPSSSVARYGCYLAIVAGVVMFIIGAYLLSSTDKPAPLSIALLVVGGLDVLLGGAALRRNRAAWAFCAATNTTLGLTFFFGSTKLRDEMDIHLVLGLVPAIVLGLAAVLLALGIDDYEG